MTLALIGINHKTAPIELRERIAISREDLPETTRALAAVPGVAECMIVSTCNRVEIVAALEGQTADLPDFCTGNSDSIRRCLRPTFTNTMIKTPCGIFSGSRQAWTQWSWVNRRFSAR